MKGKRNGHFVVIVIILAVAGCSSQQDITKSAEVQQSGLLGQRFVTVQGFELRRDKMSDILQLIELGVPIDSREQQLGEVQAGTTIMTDQVLRVTELGGFMVLPVYATSDYIMGRILNGPFTGKHVAVGARDIDSGELRVNRDRVGLVPATAPLSQ